MSEVTLLPSFRENVDVGQDRTGFSTNATVFFR